MTSPRTQTDAERYWFEHEYCPVCHERVRTMRGRLRADPTAKVVYQQCRCGIRIVGTEGWQSGYVD
ncbi:MAG: hypothetical protein OEY99_04425 [Aigarchaeota archaeon]|nr:hypothetical protein [Aigarchaeota archaeon]MDH5703438.1 hypothetical protein [Aigarchaeota archaeon]